MTARRAGLTLVELMVALLIAAFVLALAHRTVGEAVAGTARIGAASAAMDREANARRRLAAAFASLEITGRGATAFEGADSSAAFTTWLSRRDGRLHRARVQLDRDSARLRLVVLPDSAVPDTLWLLPVTALAIDYLLEPGLASPWMSQWRSPVTAPRAVRLRLGRGESVDTLLLLVGQRG